MGNRAVLPLTVTVMLIVLGLGLAGCPKPDQPGDGSAGTTTPAAKPAADYDTPADWPEPGSVVGYA